MSTNSLIEQIRAAGEQRKLLPSTVENIEAWLDAGFLPDWARSSLAELAAKEAWAELDNRFFRNLEFGTGGMRGRTIAVVATEAETGRAGLQGTPAHAGVGSNMLNDFTIVRATLGLFRYTQKHLREKNRFDLPKLVIAHDVRHFSRHFCELAASAWSRVGGLAYIFDGPRSTPQLSFAVRHSSADAGVVITASHNPPHDNGYKVYFSDGGQVVPPHDRGIIGEVNGVALGDLSRFLEIDLSRVVVFPQAADEAYLEGAADSVIDASVFEKAKLRVAFTGIHGTGGIMSVPLMRRAGVEVHEVAQQKAWDPRFPTVKSPNPENAEALNLATELALEQGLDLVLATDPDCDRVGAAVRDRQGAMIALTGNQAGALLAEYRIGKYKEAGWIPAEGTQSAALIKTFVTSPLQDAIGRAHGVKVINTLTGFKWIGEKISLYEVQLKEALLRNEGIALDYDRTPLRRRAELLQQHSTFYLFGGEESYGYLANDFVRDKDGNTACLILCELAAHVKAQGKTVPEFLDELYLKYGYFTEGIGQIYYEGAEGAARIKRILDSYRSSPPEAFGAAKVDRFTDYGREKISDADGKPIPAQDLYFLELSSGYSYAVRGSGTEPKIKFYLFAREKVSEAGELERLKEDTKLRLDALRDAIVTDAARRAE